MAGAVSGATAGGEARSYTLARHRDVLVEFTNEFKRVDEAVRTSRERDLLLSGGNAGRRNNRSASNDGGEGFSESSTTELLIRERNTVHSSTSAVEDVIGAAQATAAALVSQRGLFGIIGSNLQNAGNRFGTMHNLLAAIKRKKNKDTMILSAVVAFCTAFTLIYWLAK
jgi:Golgi SNAP receptor complex protein 1